jgi:hypothetical protein
VVTDAQGRYSFPAARLEPGKYRTTNIRRIFVDETGLRPVVWVGSNHGASIVKVEPLD